DFALDVLRALQERLPEFFSVVRYWIVEPFQVLRERQRNSLRDFRAKVDWQQSLMGLEQFCGVYFSNELLDSMPVHLISWAESNRGDSSGEWEERCVVESGEGFNFTPAPIEDAELQGQLERIPRPSGGPYETE